MVRHMLSICLILELIAKLLLKQKNKKISISENQGNFVGGLIFYTENKAYDLSFEMLLKNYNEKCESTVVKHLFDSLQAVK